jgi:hypothetical protein
MNDKIRTVRPKSRQEAAKVVERRIEEALAPKKRRLAPTPFQVESRIYPRQKREGSRRAARTRRRWVKGLTLCELQSKIPTSSEPAIYQRRMVQTAGFVSSTEVGATKNGTLARINGWL